ncbi:helix-turn-helix domain-containing protein [Lysinibacillus sphaericus]
MAATIGISEFTLQYYVRSAIRKLIHSIVSKEFPKH